MLPVSESVFSPLLGWVVVERVGHFVCFHRSGFGLSSLVQNQSSTHYTHRSGGGSVTVLFTISRQKRNGASSLCFLIQLDAGPHFMVGKTTASPAGDVKKKNKHDDNDCQCSTVTYCTELDWWIPTVVTGRANFIIKHATGCWEIRWKLHGWAMMINQY